jgi:hypothetical protein
MYFGKAKNYNNFKKIFFCPKGDQNFKTSKNADRFLRTIIRYFSEKFRVLISGLWEL